jgi:hypothetical protein
VKPTRTPAGLGATGAAFAESLAMSGLRAHLEHLLMYTGEKLANPIAQRTPQPEWGAH